MAAITGATCNRISPDSGQWMLCIVTPATADSADTIDVSSAAATGGDTLASIKSVICKDVTTGDIVTATFSGTTITIDAAGGTTNHTYHLWVIGNK